MEEGINGKKIKEKKVGGRGRRMSIGSEQKKVGKGSMWPQSREGVW